MREAALPPNFAQGRYLCKLCRGLTKPANLRRKDAVPVALQQLNLGDFVLDGGRRCLVRGDGSAVALTPRLYRALELLASRPGELFDKRELMQALWPGQVVEDNNLSQLVSALRRALGDDVEPHRYIRTEPRRGLRLVAPVSATGDSRGLPMAVESPSLRTRVAVLPFLKLSGSERDALLEVGMADSLIARLSIAPTLLVCSVGSVRRFAGRDLDPLAAGRLLDVQWVIDGTLQREAERLRAESAFRRAIELNPSAALARFGLGFMLLVIGRRDEGLDLVRAARTLDPMSLLIGTMEGSFLVQLGERAAGLERLRRMLTIEPRFWIAHMVQALAHAEVGDWDDAFASAQQAADLASQSTQALALKGAILGWAGRLDEARAVLAQLQALRAGRYVPPTSLAAVHTALGEHDQALDHLEHAGSVLDVRTIYLKDDVRWRALRSHPRFMVGHRAERRPQRVGDRRVVAIGIGQVDGAARAP